MANKILKPFQSLDYSHLNDGRSFVEKALERPNPTTVYWIFFTPRSGSSWLADLLESLGFLGKPGEWFNPGLLPNILKRYACADLFEYVQCMKKSQQSRNGVFGCEITFFQLKLLLDAIAELGLDRESIIKARDDNTIYLYRRDLLAQAISLYKAAETGYFHATQKDEGTHGAHATEYNSEAIWYWLLHVLQQEYGFERTFKELGVNPLSISYEELSIDPHHTLNRICGHVLQSVNFVGMKGRNFVSDHKKLANAVSDEYWYRFYEEYREELEFAIKNRGQIDQNGLKNELSLEIGYQC